MGSRAPQSPTLWQEVIVFHKHLRLLYVLITLARTYAMALLSRGSVWSNIIPVVLCLECCALRKLCFVVASLGHWKYLLLDLDHGRFEKRYSHLNVSQEPRSWYSSETPKCIKSFVWCTFKSYDAPMCIRVVHDQDTHERLSSVYANP